MGQHSLIYAFVARGTVVLAEHTDFTGNFTAVASQCLVKLPAATNNNKLTTYYCDGHTFNYLVQDGFTYCVVAVESVGQQFPIAFLDRVKEDFTKIYGGGKAATAAANSLNRQFGSKLKEHMQYCVDHPEEVCKLAKVRAQVSEVKGVMMENIEKVLDRGEKIELFVDKTENLRSRTDSVAKRLKVNKCSDDNNSKNMAAQADPGSAGKAVSQNQSAPEPSKQDYIHVRARRGQATDSHSLAERARREKISERMKMLQDLVPGCNKVIGKASVLDEIINYIQSLQCQVEFLSMKLEAVNAHVGSAVGAFPSKDFGAQTYNTAPGLTFDTQAPREYSQGADTSEWLHMQIGGAYERVS